MAALDLNTTKEVRGITIRSILQFIAIMVTMIIGYANITNSLDNTIQSTKELKEVLKDQRTQNEVQYRVLQNQLREQDLRLIKLEAETKLYINKIN